VLKDGVFQPALGIAADLSVVYQDVVALLAGKTKRCPFTEQRAGWQTIDCVGGVEAELPVQGEEERGEDSERFFDGGGWRKVVGGADQAVGQFRGMVDDPAAGDAADNRDIGSMAAIQVENLFRILEPSQRQCRRSPAIQAEHGE